MKNFLKNLLSIDEQRISALIVCLVGVLTFACLVYWRDKDISNNLTSVLQALILSVAGTNVIPQFTGINKKSYTTTPLEQNNVQNVVQNNNEQAKG